MATVAYRYGLLHPLDWDDDCERELRLQVDLWNRLVEIEQAHRERVRRIAAEDAEVARFEAERGQLLAERQRLLDQRAAARRAARRKIPTPEIDSQIDSARTRLKELTQEAKEARRRAYAARRAQLHSLDQERLVAVKLARRQSGLFWSNYNAVIGSYEVARQRALKEGAELRRQYYGRDARLTNQIQGGVNVEDLRAGRHSQARLGSRPEGMTNRHGAALSVTVHTREGRRRNVTWPIILHRPLPADGRVQMVTVLRTRRADRYYWQAVFTCRIPDFPASLRMGGRLAINIGWRSTPDGLRLATLVRDGQAAPQHIFLPQRILDGAQLCEEDQSDRDTALNETLSWLCGLDLTQAPVEILTAIQSVIGRPRPAARHLFHVLWQWQQRAPDWRPQDLAVLRGWNRLDRRLWRNIAERFAWRRDARLDHYWKEARRLVNHCGEIILNGHDMSATAKAGEDNLPEPVRRLRVIAAPSVLRQVIINHARKAGMEIRILDIPHDACVACGARLAPRTRPALWWTCAGCGVLFDQDEHYCRLLLARCEQSSDHENGGGARNPTAADATPGRWKRLKTAKLARVNEPLESVPKTRD